MINDTIVALATPNTKSAIAIIRLSGKDSIKIVNRFFSGDLEKVAANTINYGFINDENNNKLDEVLVSVFRAPKSFTREDIIEINIHGGIIIARKIMNLLLAHGAVLAMPGEFSQRAYLNGRIDLLEVEAIADMIDAHNDKASSLAMLGLSKKTTGLINDLKEDLIQIIAQVEAKIDYPEYDDIDDIEASEFLKILNSFKDKIMSIIDNSKSGKIIKNGLQIAIVGRPNVGKSSLLNAFLNENKAIVTDIAGTTRDIVEADYYLNDINVTFLDTAGLRISDDIVEKMGIEKSYEAIIKADLILLVLDNTNENINDDEIKIMNEYQDKVLVVINKSDLENKIKVDGIKISALNNDVELVKEAIIKKLDLDINIDNEALFLSNERHISLLKIINSNIDNALESLRNNMTNDIVIEDLERAYYHLEEILGNSNHDLLDDLFSRFCLGK
ncbi:MAG: tRNA uridine-5-carboxymethylaminomethyl(34) synthesis GTPase MnmE [Bacilli bacterium]|jgi:tRNA modification GTPase|nr:tRNA uridine-5-carboxymethylaminomethyl(34) synthesis GTPase MnmE [Bacilli bacterium]